MSSSPVFVFLPAAFRILMLWDFFFFQVLSDAGPVDPCLWHPHLFFYSSEQQLNKQEAYTVSKDFTV